MWGYLSCLAQHGDEKEVPSWIKHGLRSKHPNMDSIAEKFAQMSPGNRYLIQTSKAATIFNAGLKVKGSSNFYPCFADDLTSLEQRARGECPSPVQ